ncbi:hypothetical protein [Streptomyces sp. NPDC093261]|uniref:hypothetical protein n=1 Tax=Streptomyces sp. NPDC093261 TaxID=3366037 RepID=UPI00380A3FBA
MIFALAGNDPVDGRGGNDLICGGYGNNSLSGGNGNNALNGGADRVLAPGGPHPCSYRRAACPLYSGGMGRDSGPPRRASATVTTAALLLLERDVRIARRPGGGTLGVHPSR